MAHDELLRRKPLHVEPQKADKPQLTDIWDRFEAYFAPPPQPIFPMDEAVSAPATALGEVTGYASLTMGHQYFFADGFLAALSRGFLSPIPSPAFKPLAPEANSLLDNAETVRGADDHGAAASLGHAVLYPLGEGLASGRSFAEGGGMPGAPGGPGIEGGPGESGGNGGPVGGGEGSGGAGDGGSAA